MNIGFYLLDVANDNQKHQQLLKTINSLCESRPFDNIVIFNNQFNTIDLDHKYYILHINQAKYFDGILFVFDIKSAVLTKTFPSPKKQILLVDKNEWSIKKNVPYKFWHNIYNSDNFELIVENKDMFDLCELCWKKPISIIMNFQTKDIENVLQKIS